MHFDYERKKAFSIHAKILKFREMPKKNKKNHRMEYSCRQFCSTLVLPYDNVDLLELFKCIFMPIRKI